MAQTVLSGIDEVKAAVGRHLGTSDWLEITQERIDQFADATGDHQWIHVDPERAAAGPFGTTIAHGYLTLSLSNALLPDIVEVQGVSMGVNYGVGKVRFPAPVPVGVAHPRHRRAGGGRRRRRRCPDHGADHRRARGQRQARLRDRIHQPLPGLSAGDGPFLTGRQIGRCTLGGAMDLRFTPEEDAFRKEVRTYLDELLHGEFAVIRGRGGPGDEHAFFDERLAWERRLGADGWTCVGWPTEFGGRGLPLNQQVIYFEEYARAGGPGRLGHIGEGLIGPTLIHYGSPEQQHRFLPAIVARRRAVVPGLLRARRRIGPGQRRHPSRPRR